GWVNGTLPNHGLLLEQAEPVLTRFKTSEWPVASLRPKLNLCYQASCDPGFADCDGNGKNGCETDLESSAGNCGACGNACAIPNAAAACEGGACAFVGCNAGF